MLRNCLLLISRIPKRKFEEISCLGQVCSNSRNIFGGCVTVVPAKSLSTEQTLREVSKSIMSPAETNEFQRLPRNITPKHYKLLIEPDLDQLTFEGCVEIDVNVEVNDCYHVVLNMLELQNVNASVTPSDGKVWAPTETIQSNEKETVSMLYDKPLPPGPAVVKLNFKGNINDNMKGLYRSKYTSVDGVERYAAVTQFEATDARRCFPCWDEPALKATFDISIACPKDRVCLSNMPEKSESVHNGKRVVNFERTPIMSTYLVAFVVGEYEFIEDTSADGVRVRVYTPVGKTEQGKFALDVATKVLPYYKDYFNMAYPLPKIDLITITNFSAGAMENWGLVTYRETCLLVDPKNTSAVSKQWVALVVGHELAHQWFGNLVTMEWWTHLWLNEGYASFVEFLCVEHLFPEYDIWTQFVTETYCRALELDGLKNSHPIEVPVGHPSEIDEIFDDISYNKGASIIRMLHKYIGDANFRKGMNIYLTRHKYSNTFTEDLWAALEEASSQPVAAVMSTWTKQKGYPLVRVTASSSDSSKTVLSLQQERFFIGGKPDEEPTLWMVPVTITTEQANGVEVVSTVLETQSTNVQVPKAGNGWIKLNPGTVGFYRTQYSPELLTRFYPAIRNNTLPPLDRLGLLDDLFALVQAGETPTVEILKIMQEFRGEENYTVWSTINNCVGKLSILLSFTPLEEVWRRHLQKLFLDIYHKLGWEPKTDESHLDTLLRSLVIGRLAGCGEKSVLEESRRRFAAHLAGTETIPADLRSAVYRAVMTYGDSSTYDSMLQLYRKADLHEERDRICRSLGAIRDEATLSKVLDFALSDEVRSQDSVFVITSVAAHTRMGRQLAWEFFKNHSALLLERYQGGFLLSRLVKYTTENFASEELAKEIEAFFEKNKIPGTERTVQQSLEVIRLNEAWLKRDLPAITTFLNEQNPK